MDDKPNNNNKNKKSKKSRKIKQNNKFNKLTGTHNSIWPGWPGQLIYAKPHVIHGGLCCDVGPSLRSYKPL